MKRFCLILALVLATSATAASARSIDPTPVIAKVDIFNYGSNVRMGALLGDGRFQVKIGNEIVTRTLSPLALAALERLAIQLSYAEITTETREHICVTFAAVNTNTLSIGKYDSEHGEFVPFAGTKVVLTHQGCQMREVVRPVDAHHRMIAEELTTALYVLSLDTVRE